MDRPIPLMPIFLLLSTVLVLSVADQGTWPGDWDAEAFQWSMAASVSSTLRRGRGRPRKFPAPSRAVTLTLPESVLTALANVHADISKAVVQLAQRRRQVRERPLAELTVFGRNAVITVRPSRSLERRAGLQLVPLPDGRALLSFDQPTTIADLELTLHDALEDPQLSDEDRKIFQAIAGILKDARRSRDVTLHRRNIIVLEANGRRRPNSR